MRLFYYFRACLRLKAHIAVVGNKTLEQTA